MQTSHLLLNQDASNLNNINNDSVDLIVTSPPYPMVEMWDEIFAKQNPDIRQYLEAGSGALAFIKMHEILNNVWNECDRVLKPSGFLCINIGDATRTLNGNFSLFSNHTEIIKKFTQMGYSLLPDIHWCKPTNSPNKFMGSGMYPAGAYVTYEHEYILIFRKGTKRIFSSTEKTLRQESAYFWEERNIWFSDLWNIKGSKQIINKKSDRSRSGSFPIEIPYRLINMYSIYGDTILDPFGGLGTTSIASILTGRNSISVDVSSEITKLAKDRISNISTENFNNFINNRIYDHINFVNKMEVPLIKKCYSNETHNFLVKTKQEVKSKFYVIKDIKNNNNNFDIKYDLWLAGV